MTALSIIVAVLSGVLTYVFFSLRETKRDAGRMRQRIAEMTPHRGLFRITSNGSKYRVERFNFPVYANTPDYVPVSEAQHLDYTGALNELARTMSDKGEPTFTEVKI